MLSDGVKDHSSTTFTKKVYTLHILTIYYHSYRFTYVRTTLTSATVNTAKEPRFADKSCLRPKAKTSYDAVFL